MADPRIRELLTDGLEGDTELVRAAEGIVAYTQFLLEDDDNLTRLGNLTGDAKAQLQQRTLELLGTRTGVAAEELDEDEPGVRE